MPGAQVGTLPPETEVLVLAVLDRRVKQARAAARATIEHRYADGDRRTIRSPLDDRRLGVVYRTDPDPEWTVADPDVLADHLAADPVNVETVDDICGSDAQVVAVLAAHAPHLLARVQRVRSSAVAAAVAAAAGGGIPAPGVARVKPGGSLVVRPDPSAEHAVQALVDAAWITWDGRPAQLPSGDGGCPGCGAPVHTDQPRAGRGGAVWHDGCMAAADNAQTGDR